MALWEGDRSSIFSDVVFTGEFKLARKATGYEKKQTPKGTGFARPREPTFRHHSTVAVTDRFL
jgi:hypothetical protein